MSKHWHVASGQTGCGPETADGVQTAEAPMALAEVVREELQHWVEFEQEGAGLFAAAEDYEKAWFTLQHAEELEILRRNLDNARSEAPLYQGNQAAWEDTIRQIVTSDQFPVDVNDGRTRVYVWVCTEEPCELIGDDDVAE